MSRWRAGARLAGRFAVYVWAFPTTLPGLLLLPAAWAGGGRVRLVEGVLEAHGPLVAWMLRRLVPLPSGAAAITIGHVVFGRDQACLDASRQHERVHVRQCERWGPFFIPLYFLFSLLAWRKGGRAYADNRFERQAREGEGRRFHLPASDQSEVSHMKRTTLLFVAASCILLVMAAGSCNLFGEKTGVCVSDAVTYSYGQRVYCYSDFTEGECDEHDASEVNGASWSFHSGQTCADRDLDEGSNPWP